MPAMGAPDCDDIGGVFAGSEPIANLCANGAAHLPSVHRVYRPGPSGYNQHNTSAHSLGLGQTMHKPGIGTLKRGSMQVESEIGRQRAASEALFP